MKVLNFINRSSVNSFHEQLLCATIKGMDDTLPPEEETRSKPLGPFIAPIIIALLIALGGIYFLVTQELKIRAIHSAEQINS